MNHTDVMIDLETLGTAPGSVILSIGAVVLTPPTPEALAVYQNLKSGFRGAIHA